MADVGKLQKLLAKKAQKQKIAKYSVELYKDIEKSWRYIDFWDVRRNKPNLVLEWLFGCRGLLAGRVLFIRGDAHAGKTSFVINLFAMGLKTGNVYPIYMETEKAPLTKERVMELGIDLDSFIMLEPLGLVECLEEVESIILTIREQLDKAKQYPILIGIDSVSGLANESIDPNTGKLLSGSKASGLHSREFSSFFRNKLTFMSHNYACLILTGQLKSKIQQGTFGGFGGGSEKTTIAEGAIKYHATWQIDLTRLKSTEAGASAIKFRVTKNKIKGTSQNKEIILNLYEDERGWDYTDAFIGLLKGNYSPFSANELIDSKNGRYGLVGYNDGKTMLKEEFVDFILSNDELITKIRKAWKIKGYDTEDA